MTDHDAVVRVPIDWGEPASGSYTIAEIVGRAGVPASSIHHYRRLGLVPEPTRNAANQHRYDERHVTALAIVRTLRRRGCTLDEIHDVLPTLLRDRDENSGDASALLAGIGDRSPETKLIDAAIEAFAEHSFREVSITALCERADVAKGTFYRCFDRKEALFLATARAIVDRATRGFAADSEHVPAADHAACFAHHLRPGLPVLLEMAKRIIQETGPSVAEAATLFAGLARQLGRVVDGTARDDQAEQAGGLLIMVALVKIFEELLASEITAPDPPCDAHRTHPVTPAGPTL